MGKFYPESPEMSPSGLPTMWPRHRIIIPCADEEQMERISEKVAEFCGHYQEIFAGITENGTNKILAEVPFCRKSVPTNIQVPVNAIGKVC